MKLRNYIVTYRLHCGPQTTELSHRLFVELRNRLHRLIIAKHRRPSSVERSYFARYVSTGNRAEVRISLALHVGEHSSLRSVTETAKFVYQQVALNGAKTVIPGWLGEDVKVEKRGELSELHSLIMAAALHPCAKDPQQLADAFHWCLNAAGYHYTDEVMIASGMAYNAGRCTHPNPGAAPLPYGFDRGKP